MQRSLSRDRRTSISSGDHFDLEASLDSLRRSNERSHHRRRGNSLLGSETLGTIFQKVLPGGSVDSNDMTGSIWTSKDNYSTDVQLLFKRRITTLYIQYTSLKSYVELNHSGFRKILKK